LPAVSNALNEATSNANAKLRQLVVFYCVVLLSFFLRTAYAGLLVYASSATAPNSSPHFDYCVNGTVPTMVYEWAYFSQEIPAILSALSSAMLTVLSLLFIVTPAEKNLLCTGRSASEAGSVETVVSRQLNDLVGLNQLL
jgi:hypothetical protein